MASDTDKYPDDILRVCSTSQRDLGIFLIRPILHRMQTVQESLQTAFKTPPASRIGILDRLPPELILMVIYHLDILSHLRFRQVNRHARVLSTASQEYRLVIEHGLEGVQSLLRTGLAHNFAITDLYRCLISPNCTLCGCFGGFIFLPTAMRSCFSCIMTSTEHRVTRMSTLAKIAQISTSELDRLLTSIPRLRPVPSLYSMEEGNIKHPKFLFIEEQAIATLKSLGVLQKDFAYNFTWSKDYVNERFLASTELPWYNLDKAQTEYGVSCKGCQPPLYCLYINHGNRRRKFFSTTDYLIHFKNCAKAQNMWAKDQQAMRLFKELGYRDNSTQNSTD